MAIVRQKGLRGGRVRDANSLGSAGRPRCVHDVRKVFWGWFAVTGDNGGTPRSVAAGLVDADYSDVHVWGHPRSKVLGDEHHVGRDIAEDETDSVGGRINVQGAECATGLENSQQGNVEQR